MLTWILILVLAGDHNSAAGVSVTSVPNFVTEKACKAAGDASVAAFRGAFHSASFVCVAKL